MLSELENSLLELEDNPDDMEQIGRVFRAMHTIKGSGAMFGFDDIADFTHNVEGEIVPYILLRDEYDIQDEPPEIEQVVIMETNGKRVGFVVGEVIGGHQTVIKNLSSVFKEAKDISGATILGDSSVALIVDVIKIVDF